MKADTGGNRPRKIKVVKSRRQREIEHRRKQMKRQQHPKRTRMLGRSSDLLIVDDYEPDYRLRRS